MNTSSIRDISDIIKILKDQGIAYSLKYLQSGELIFEIPGPDDTVGSDDDILCSDDDTLDLYKECSATKTDNKKRKTTPEESLRGQCSLRKVDVEKLIKTDIISSLELLRQYLYSHAKSSGVTLGPKQHYSTISSYAKDHLGEVVAQLHSEYPSLYYSCVVTGEKERPHSLRRRS